MDILHLVDRLEELFNESRPIPLTHSVVVDEDRVLEIIDQMRISIPDEVKKAKAHGKPWYAPYLTIPGVLVIAALLVPVYLRFFR